MAKEKQKTEKKYDFTPIAWDPDNVIPNAAEGEYTAKITDVKIQASKDNFPQVVIEWTLKETATETEEAEKSVGATVQDRLTFFPDSEGRRGNPSKIQFRQLKELLDLDDDILPAQLREKSDFDDLKAALKGQEATVFVIHRPRDGGGEPYVNVSYLQPRSSANGAAKASAEDLDEDEEKPKKKKGLKAKDEDEDEEEELDDLDEDEEEEEEEEEDEPKPKKKLKR